MTTTNNHRAQALLSWVKQYISSVTATIPIPGDAGFRRYFRIQSNTGTYIAVDAPPDHENTISFVAIAKAFASHGLHVPEVIEVNHHQGFMLLSDLGDTQLLKVLNQGNVIQHYSTAFNDLLLLQSCTHIPDWQLPLFGEDLLAEELARFHNWYLQQYLGLQLTTQDMKMLNQSYRLLIQAALAQPQVCVHRDYHSRNLMLLPNQELGILDFQDAVIGPITYDLVSLLKDCYIAWQANQVYDWVLQYWHLLEQQNVASLKKVTISEFMQWFDWMGLQRHLKVLGIFARLYLRDNKPTYLRDIPRTLQYILFVCKKYSEFEALHQFLIKRVMPYESNDFGSRTRDPLTSTNGCNS